MSNLLSVSSSDTPKAVGVERRAWVRYPCALESTCQPLGTARGLQWTGKILNISCGGVALLLGRRFEVGTLLALEVPKSQTRDSLTLMARVAHVSTRPGGNWQIGCAFTHAISDEDLQALL
jgi:hypothetical protein